jgi:hypothetical protein
MSWERSRSIPWDRIRQDVPDPDAYKSKVFRDLQRETTETDLDGDKIGGISGHKASSYSTGDLLKQAAFGACIGSITGAVFGFMDGMRTAGESPVLQKASNVAKGKYLLQGTTRSATLFGVFFSGFHLVSVFSPFLGTLAPGRYRSVYDDYTDPIYSLDFSGQVRTQSVLRSW